MKKTLKIEAIVENLTEVLEFAESGMEEVGASMKIITTVTISLEEMFVNVAHYAYNDIPAEADNYGSVVIDFEVTDEDIIITLTDWGIPYDPLKKPDPDVSLSIEERPIGGLGIFMVKKQMDEVKYVREDGKNIFTMIKKR